MHTFAAFLDGMLRKPGTDPLLMQLRVELLVWKKFIRLFIAGLESSFFLHLVSTFRVLYFLEAIVVFNWNGGSPGLECEMTHRSEPPECSCHSQGDIAAAKNAADPV